MTCPDCCDAFLPGVHCTDHCMNDLPEPNPRCKDCVGPGPTEIEPAVLLCCNQFEVAP